MDRRREARGQLTPPSQGEPGSQDPAVGLSADAEAVPPHPAPAPDTSPQRPDAEAVRRTVEATWRIEAAKIIAALSRYVGDFGLAEDLAQEAVTDALCQWPESGVPSNPAAWLTTVAKRRAIDSWRRRERLDERVAMITSELEISQKSTADELPWDPDVIDDDVLRLVFISCHPVLNREAQLALTLRVVGGLTSEQIARAFLVPVSTVQQRIVRAKKKLAAAGVPFELPPANERSQRLAGVLGVLYLLFSEGHVATSGPDWMRPELAMDALRLTRVTAALMPREPEVHGLVALMALTASRFPSRVRADGRPILLGDQDRSRWDRSIIRLGERSLRTALTLREARGAYTIQAQIAAVHAAATSVDSTDWTRIAALYADLGRAAPSPITDLNRAIAVAEADSPDAGLRLVDELAASGVLAKLHLIPSVRGELLSRLGRLEEARAEFDRAARLATNERERDVLLEKARRPAT
ncbi:RNA polymerase sigma factor (sigma-70 family) [Brevibacterium sanguinis]|uniref:RNA polymerase sigma factor (Sigma-70 family) n=2 Tax=Brevibacterium TaxID=1696 RepID=A0A366IHB7_9MICO|nr:MULTISPECIES: sigma-70 family RNA polymerase sigma factor [Brevibacterium]RBP63437.1 RNA polymerase sigma factor (sigma-70 family) [Brevibacterium sanguinis]RBP69904.1 RNA polymerase sigma factor (sigma-70 family) [Brevibacterium celere]